MSSSPRPFAVSFKKLLLAALLGAALAGLSGCVVAAAGAGAGAVAYLRGDLEANLDSNLDHSGAATRQAVKDLGFAQISDNKDAVSEVLIARTATDKKVEIRLSNSGKELTHIKIRVGLFGDEMLSNTILDKIKARL